MAKESFLNRAIKKAVNIKTDAAWDAHAEVFGSLMRPIFGDDDKARAKLCLALTYLADAKPEAAADVLEQDVKPLCKTDAEMAACLYFSALSYEAMKARTHVWSCLTEALTYAPQSFRVYYKAAAYAYADGLFGFAEENYQKAIRFMEENPSEPAKDYWKFLATAYCKLALAQTMMHRYGDAERSLARAEEMAAPFTEIESAKAILYAARGEKDRVKKSLGILCLEDDLSHREKANAITREILCGKHPQFSEIPVDPEDIRRFWAWFVERMEDASPSFAKEISKELRRVFPFFKKTIDVSMNEKGNVFFFSDYYAKSISCGLDLLFGEMPETLHGQIRLMKIH